MTILKISKNIVIHNHKLSVSGVICSLSIKHSPGYDGCRRCILPCNIDLDIFFTESGNLETINKSNEIF